MCRKQTFVNFNYDCSYTLYDRSLWTSWMMLELGFLSGKKSALLTVLLRTQAQNTETIFGNTGDKICRYICESINVNMIIFLFHVW